MPNQDPIKILEQDHQRVRSLFEQIQKAAGTEGGDSESEELVEELIDTIQNHTTIEEEIFYPAFQQAVRGKGEERLYFESMEEHHVVDMVMPEVEESAQEGDGMTFAAKVKVLKDIVMHHIEEEENDLFPKVRKVMKAAELRELGERMTERKEELMELQDEELESEEREEEYEAEDDEDTGIEAGAEPRGARK